MEQAEVAAMARGQETVELRFGEAVRMVVESALCEAKAEVDGQRCRELVLSALVVSGALLPVIRQTEAPDSKVLAFFEDLLHEFRFEEGSGEIQQQG